MIITSTPYRISFFGGGTDYPVWFQEHGGAVLATTINRYCYITCRLLPPFFSYRHRIVWSQVETVNDVTEIVHPAVREAIGPIRRWVDESADFELVKDGGAWVVRRVCRGGGAVLALRRRWLRTGGRVPKLIRMGSLPLLGLGAANAFLIV